jgi:hypothetical protein
MRTGDTYAYTHVAASACVLTRTKVYLDQMGVPLAGTWEEASQTLTILVTSGCALLLLLLLLLLPTTPPGPSCIRNRWVCRWEALCCCTTHLHTDPAATSAVDMLPPGPSCTWTRWVCL